MTGRNDGLESAAVDREDGLENRALLIQRPVRDRGDGLDDLVGAVFVYIGDRRPTTGTGFLPERAIRIQNHVLDLCGVDRVQHGLAGRLELIVQPGDLLSPPGAFSFPSMAREIRCRDRRAH